MKTTIALLLTACLAAPAFAQTKPSDVPDYVEVNHTFASGPVNSNPNIIGDGSTTDGGVMPSLAKQPPDYPSTAPGWIVGGAERGQPVPDSSLDSTEVKARFFSNVSHISADDPIRAWCIQGGSHLHEFFGNTSTNACSTYKSLRDQANYRASHGQAASTFAGGPYNGTGYWFPCPIKMNPFGNGRNYCVKAGFIVVYYTANPSRLSTYSQRLPRGLRYVFGVNMDDPDDLGIKAEIAAANAKPNTSGRYSYAGNGFNGWKCINNAGTVTINTTDGKDHSPALVNSNGSDPWGGQCVAGMNVVAEAGAPQCYDGNNLWAPGGYKHLYQQIAQNNGTFTCRSGDFRLPRFILTVWFNHQGPSDYMTWRLSSDDMAAQVAGHPFRNGESFHTDWMNGWDDTTLVKWLTNCVGNRTQNGADCQSATISATERLIGGYGGENAPDLTRTPQINHDPSNTTTSTPGGMFEIPPNVVGPITINAKPK